MELYDCSWFQQLDYQIALTSSRIAQAEKTNAQKNEAQAKLTRCIELEQRVTAELNRLIRVEKASREISTHYESEIIENLEVRVKTVLEIAFPQEHFEVSLKLRIFRNEYVADVRIGRPNGKGDITWLFPKYQNGDGAKQIISFAIIASINLMMGTRFLIMDEPFSSGDEKTLLRLKPVLEYFLEAGLQIILIEHKEQLFDALTVNDIHLEKEHSTAEFSGKVTVLHNGLREPKEC